MENILNIENEDEEEAEADDNENDDEEKCVWKDFANILADPPPKRNVCSRCQRPVSVCFCLAIEPIVNLLNHLIILQHPNELKRCLRTTRILELSIPSSNYHLFNGKRFNRKNFPLLHELIDERPTVLLYPSCDSKLFDCLEINNDNGYNVVILDGTWSQAREIFNNNEFLHSLPCYKLDPDGPSKYVRRQPTESCLSTVEAAAMVLARLESNISIYHSLTRPLKTICDFQLDNGAVHHHSKEFLISNGLYTKPLSKKIRRKLEMCNEKNGGGGSMIKFSMVKDLVHLLDR